MKKEELERLEEGQGILEEIKRAQSTIDIVNNLLSEYKIKEGIIVVCDGYESTRVPLNFELCSKLLKVVYHALNDDIIKLEKQFEEL